MPHKTMTFQTLARLLEVGHDGEKKFLEDALDEALAKVGGAADRTNQKAKLVLTIIAEPTARGELQVGAAIKTTLPEPGTFPVRLWTHDGGLVGEDPEQPKLPLSGSMDAGEPEERSTDDIEGVPAGGEEGRRRHRELAVRRLGNS